MSEPCLPCPPAESQRRPHLSMPSAESNSSRRPYHRQMSEPLVAMPQQGFKQELIDPRYVEQDVPTMCYPGSPQGPQNVSFYSVNIKQEPRDFGFDSGEQQKKSQYQPSMAISLVILSAQRFSLEMEQLRNWLFKSQRPYGNGDQPFLFVWVQNIFL